jgi:N-carbamoylputrescine amidase
MTPKENTETTVGLVQMACSDSLEENLDRAIAGIHEAAKKGAQIVCLQELFRSQYFCQTEDTTRFSLSENIAGPTTKKLSRIAKELNLVLVAPIFEKRTEGIYHNSAIVLDADGSIKGHYRKMHIPDDPCFNEKFYFTPGDLGFLSFQTRFARIGILICWDQWFPEAARLTALSGAQIIFYPTAIGYQKIDASVKDKQISAWQTVQKSHAITNGVFVAAVNRTGVEDSLTFWGKSFIADPSGEVLAEADESSTDVITAKCDLSKIEQVRRDWPFLRDRRVDHYHNLHKIFNDPLTQ